MKCLIYLHTDWLLNKTTKERILINMVQIEIKIY